MHLNENTFQFRRIVPKAQRPVVVSLLRQGMPLPHAIVAAAVLPALIQKYSS